MILTGLLWDRVMIATRSVRVRVLHQPLADFNIRYFKVGTFSARASDTILLIDDQLTDEVHVLMILLYC